MIGKIYDDYKITEKLFKRNNQQYYRLQCQVCGHEKECGGSNIIRQDNHHSCRNCRDDYYNSLVGKQFGEYVCKSVEYVSKTKGYIATLECSICGHRVETHTSNIKKRKHSAAICGTDYHKSLIGKNFGDLEIIGVENEYRNSAIVYSCKCTKCGLESKQIMASLKREIKHGTHCFKLLPTDEFKTTISRRYNLMYQRCNNPKNTEYKHYGARGIKLLYENAIDLYFDFIDELRDHAKIYGLRNSTFDRIDVNGNYEKNNLRITHQQVQSTNTTRKKIFILEKGKERILSDSAMECGRFLEINGHSVRNVISGSSKSCNGWTLYRIVNCNEDLEDVINSEGVTTKLIVC